MKFSITKCQPVQLNDCTEHSLCFSIFKRHRKDCNSYLQTISKDTPLSINYFESQEFLIYDTYETTLEFSLLDNTCIILELTRQNTNSVSNWACEFKLRTKHISLMHRIVEYQVLGMFRNIRNSYIHIEEKEYSSIQNVMFYRGHNLNESVGHRRDSDVPFYIHKEFNTPTTIYPWKLKITRTIITT